jgi:flagellar biosynthesis protein FlhF
MSVMLQELKAVRQAVETRLAEANIALLAGRHPLRLQLTADLLAAGFSTALVQRLMEKLPAEHGREAARAWFAEALVRNLRGAERVDPCVEEGGVYALVGPTGVGKTTTAAKLAARCVLQRGAEHVALISTDGYRVGAQEQLRAFAKILGVQARVARTAQELSQALVELSARHLVLIDTAGMGQRDRRVVEQNAMLAHCGGGLRSILLLAASAARETLDDVHAAYRGTALAGVALTKVDESVALGAALDVLLRAQLPLLYVANGQRVPEDLHLPNRAYLVSQALRGAPVPASPDGVAATLLARGGAGALAFA